MADNRTISQLEAEGYPRMRVLQGNGLGPIQDDPGETTDAQRYDARPDRRQDALRQMRQATRAILSGEAD